MASVYIKGIYHCYGSDSFELRIEDLTIPDGQITALVGQSGCGKTTLLRSIAGLEIPSNGTISINDKVVSSDSVHVPPEKRNIGLVFQDYALFPHLTVRKNIEFGLGGLDKDERDQRIKSYTSLTHLEAFLERYPHELSGGQQQRVAVTRALVCKPKVLLLDEPFSNMDEPMKVKLRSEIKSLLKETQTTTLMVSHDIRDAFAIADTIIILNQGQVEQIGTQQELVSSPNSEYVSSMVNITQM